MSQPITCQVTRWYHKRMILMSLMLLGFAAFFFYDGFIAYPKKNHIFREHKRVSQILDERSKFLNQGGSPTEWARTAREKGYPEEDNWSAYAAKHGWSDKPPEKEYSTRDQFVCGGLLSLIGLGVLGTYLKNRKQTVGADEEAYIAPSGERVAFASVNQLDTRKWAKKGLAYLRYRDAGGKEKRIALDDLKFGGAEKILERLKANFNGELIESVVVSPPESDPGAAKSAES